MSPMMPGPEVLPVLQALLDWEHRCATAFGGAVCQHYCHAMLMLLAQHYSPLAWPEMPLFVGVRNHRVVCGSRHSDCIWTLVP
jgi:hypothetical protein